MKRTVIFGKNDSELFAFFVRNTAVQRRGLYDRVCLFSLFFVPLAFAFVKVAANKALNKVSWKYGEE